jgi:hypothetical protein
MRKRARTDLCGGRSVMVVPTATVNPPLQLVGLLEWGKAVCSEVVLQSGQVTQ